MHGEMLRGFPTIRRTVESVERLPLRVRSTLGGADYLSPRVSEYRDFRPHGCGDAFAVVLKRGAEMPQRLAVRSKFNGVYDQMASRGQASSAVSAKIKAGRRRTPEAARLIRAGRQCPAAASPDDQCPRPADIPSAPECHRQVGAKLLHLWREDGILQREIQRASLAHKVLRIASERERRHRRCGRVQLGRGYGRRDGRRSGRRAAARDRAYRYADYPEKLGSQSRMSLAFHLTCSPREP